MKNRLNYITITLANNLRVVAVPQEHLHYFVIGAFVAMGSRFEPISHTGVSHFIEHMLFQGSKAYPTGTDVTMAVDRIAGQIVASTSPEYCYFGLGVHRKYSDEAIAILADILQYPNFDPEEIEHEKKIVLEERAQFHDHQQRNLSIDELLFNLLTRAEEQDISLVGTVATIAEFRREMLVDYWKRHFVAENMVLVVAGAFDEAETFPIIRRHFDALPSGQTAEPQELQISRKGPGVVFRHQSSPMISLAMAWRAVPFNHPDYSAYAAVCELLGAGNSCRLFNRIREELGLVYDISCSLVSGSEFGWLQIDTSVSGKNYKRTLLEIMKTVEQFINDPLSQDELEVCKEKLVCGLQIAHDDPTETASWYARQTLLLGADRIISLEEELTQINALTVDSLIEVSKRMFVPENYQTAVVGPVGWRDRRRTRTVIQQYHPSILS